MSDRSVERLVGLGVLALACWMYSRGHTSAVWVILGVLGALEAL